MILQKEIFTPYRRITLIILSLIFFVDMKVLADPPVASYTIAVDGGNNKCLQQSQVPATLTINVQGFSINPSGTQYKFKVYLNGSSQSTQTGTSFPVNNVKNGDKIKVVTVDKDDDSKQYGEQELTAKITAIPNYSLTVLTSTVCLDNSGNNGTVRLRISPYTAGATYDFHFNGNLNGVTDPPTPFDDKKDGTFERDINGGIADNTTASYFVTVTENGCASSKIYSGNVTFKRSPKLNEKPSYLRYLSQGGTIILKDLFNNTNGTFDNDYTFEDLSGKGLVVKQGSSWIFKGDEAGEGVYKNIIAYTPKNATCLNGKTTIGTELKILNDKES
ncbi:MAG: hypothetical protein J7604_26165, partial [Sporocytophaga sp.]|uniref:hypothetical protein n=1 Tax=Sporocytophaga sp. TaxID=2231183 RepID=UPI001B1D0EE8